LRPLMRTNKQRSEGSDFHRTIAHQLRQIERRELHKARKLAQRETEARPRPGMPRPSVPRRPAREVTSEGEGRQA